MPAPTLYPASLGGLIDLIGTITFTNANEPSKNTLGHVYEYFLGQFALAEGKKGGQFYTPAQCSSNYWWKCWSLTKAAFRPLLRFRRALFVAK